jgi:putative Mn2+ efflux pump MntP
MGVFEIILIGIGLSFDTFAVSVSTGLLKKSIKFWQGVKIAVVLALVGSGFLAYTGHLGATLVYQQAAGVHIPSEDCHEFID